MTSQSLSLQFIGLFNELDKYLELVLNDCDQHMNFNHKLKLVSQWDYPISHIVHEHFYELNYLGEVRNQLVHGMNLDGQEYIVPTQHAMDQLSMVTDVIVNHQERQLVAHMDDMVVDIIWQMSQEQVSCVLVYDGDDYVTTLSPMTLLQCIPTCDHDVHTLTIGDLGLQHKQ